MTSPGRFSDYQVHQWLKDFRTCWVALHSDNPDLVDAYTSELFGGAYVRQKASFSDPNNRSTWNIGALKFAGLPASVITHMAAWDAASNGNYLGSAPLPSPVRSNSGGRYEIGENIFAMSFR